MKKSRLNAASCQTKSSVYSLCVYFLLLPERLLAKRVRAPMHSVYHVFCSSINVPVRDCNPLSDWHLLQIHLTLTANKLHQTEQSLLNSPRSSQHTSSKRSNSDHHSSAMCSSFPTLCHQFPEALSRCGFGDHGGLLFGSHSHHLSSMCLPCKHRVVSANPSVSNSSQRSARWFGALDKPHTR